MSRLLGRASLLAAALLLAYVFFAGYQYKRLLREDKGVNFVMSLPSDIYAAAMAAFLLTLAGTVLLADGFKSGYSEDESPLKCVDLNDSTDARGLCQAAPLTALIPNHSSPPLRAKLDAPFIRDEGDGAAEEEMKFRVRTT